MKTVRLTGPEWALVHNMLAHRGPEIQDEYMRNQYRKIAQEIQDQVWK